MCIRDRFRTTVFNQTSVIWALALGLVSLSIVENPEIKQWQKSILIILIAVIAFCADWSSVAVLAITDIGTNRGNFKKQMTRMMIWVAVYAVVYAVFISPVYGIVQIDRKSTRLNSSHSDRSRMPSSA